MIVAGQATIFTACIYLAWCCRCAKLFQSGRRDQTSLHILQALRTSQLLQLNTIKCGMANSRKRVLWVLFKVGEIFLFQWFHLQIAYCPFTVGQRTASPCLSLTCNGGVFVLFPVLFSKNQLLLAGPLGQQHLLNSSKCRPRATSLCRTEEGWQELTPHLNSQQTLVPVSWQSIGCDAWGADKPTLQAMVWQEQGNASCTGHLMQGKVLTSPHGSLAGTIRHISFKAYVLSWHANQEQAITREEGMSQSHRKWLLSKVLWEKSTTWLQNWTSLVLQ